VREKKRCAQQLLIRNSGGANKTAAGGMPLQKTQSMRDEASGLDISKGLSSLKQRTQAAIPQQIHSNN